METPVTGEDKQRLQSILDDHASKLAEHFDSVRLFATVHSEEAKGDTVAFETGRGNFHAQLGQVWEWMEIQKQFQRSWAIRNDDTDEA